jgi:polyisoprenoid-binding protein YceI
MARTRRTIGLMAGAAVAVLAVAIAGGLWFFFRDDAPEQASIEAAGKTLGQGRGDAVAQADGTWTVDPAVGKFADFSNTWAGYRFNEQLSKIGAVTAVGRTPAVTGTMTVDSGKVTDVALNVDLTKLKSDKAYRDKALHHRGLESDKYPMATFKLTDPVAIPAPGSSGQVTTTVDGTLTAHGVTKDIKVAVDARMTNGRIAVVGRAPVQMSAFNIKPPTGYAVLSIKDQGMFEFQIFFAKS